MARKIVLCIAFCVCAFVFSGQRLKAQNVVVSTNVIEWGLLCPNLEFALVTGEKSSFHLGAVYANHPYKWDFSGVLVTPEYRHWLKGRPFSRLYVGGAAGFAAYRYNCYEGVAVMLGPTVGYDIVLGSKWSVDFYAGFGCAYYRRRQVGQGTDSALVEPVASGFSPAILKAGVSFVFYIK